MYIHSSSYSVHTQFIFSDRITNRGGERPWRGFFQLGLWRESIWLSAPRDRPASQGLDPGERLGPLRVGLPWMNASSPGERSRAGWDRWDGRSSRASGASTCVAASACRGRVGRRHSTSRLESAGTGRPSRTQTRNSSHQSAADSTCAFCCTRSVARSDCSSSATRWQAGGGLGRRRRPRRPAARGPRRRAPPPARCDPAARSPSPLPARPSPPPSRRKCRLCSDAVLSLEVTGFLEVGSKPLERCARMGPLNTAPSRYRLLLTRKVGGWFV